MDQSMLLTLIAYLLAATWCDFNHFRIPNTLTITAFLLGVLLSSYTGSGLVFSLAGGLTGLALFIVPYAFKKMGAGDVKMLATAGTYLGPVAVLWAALWSLMIGGVVAIIWLFYIRIRPKGSYELIKGADGCESLELSRKSTVMPYAVAIAIGTLMASFQVNKL